MINKTREVGPVRNSNLDKSTIQVYRDKNYELAKKVAELQKNYAESTKDREKLQQALFHEKRIAHTYATKFQSLMRDCQIALNQIVGLSTTLTNIMGKLSVNNIAVSPLAENNKTPTSPSQQQKTKAVKPMVSGCTISKPTIKLNRISEQLLQARITNNENRSETESEQEEVLQPFVNLRRLPERLNVEEIEQQMQNDDEIQNDDLAVSESNGILQENLSTITEHTETGNSRSLQIPETTTEYRSPSPINGSNKISRYTSTPIRLNTLEPSTSGLSSASINNNSVSFVTKRPVRKRSAEPNTQLLSPKRISRKFSPGSPRVILKRISGENRVKVKSEIKTENVSPVKRPRRNAAAKVKSFKEPSLTKKLRRSR